MYFLNQLKKINEYYQTDEYSFYNKDALDSVFAGIAGSPTFDKARVRLGLICIDLQTILKFLYGFFDYQAFVAMDNREDSSDYKLPNEKLLVKSIIQKVNQGNNASWLMRFEPIVEEDDDVQEMNWQLSIIKKFVNIEKFQDSAAKLLGKGKYRQNESSKKNLAKVCQGIEQSFEMLNDVRRFLVCAEESDVTLTSMSTELTTQVINEKSMIMASLGKIKKSVEALKLNLCGIEYSHAWPEFRNYGTYFRAQSMSEDTLAFIDKVCKKHPTLSIMFAANYLLSPHNHYALLHEMDLAIESHLVRLLEVKGFKSLRKSGDVTDKKKSKNSQKFNDQYLLARSELSKAITRLRSYFPILLQVRFMQEGFDKPHNNLAVIAKDLNANDLPEQTNLNIILINENPVALSYAEMAIEIISTMEYLKAATDVFKKIKILVKNDVTIALAKANKARFELKTNYENLSIKLKENGFDLEDHAKFISLGNSLHRVIIPRMFSLNDEYFSIQADDYQGIRSSLKKINVFKKFVAIANEEVSSFAVLSTQLITKGIYLESRYLKTKDVIDSALKYLSDINGDLVMSVETAELLAKASALAQEIKLAYAACPKPKDVAEFDTIERKLETIQLEIVRLKSLIVEISKKLAISPENKSSKIVSFTNNPHRMQLTDAPPIKLIEKQDETVFSEKYMRIHKYI